LRPTRIDQVVPSFGGRDAIGTHILLLRDLLRELGYESDVWCKGSFPETRAISKSTDDLSPTPRQGTWWLYHLSSGSPVAEQIAKRPEPKLIDYHNVTPGNLFGSWVPWATEEAEAGRQQLKLLAESSVFCFADSTFNAKELRAVGMDERRTVVVPPLFDPAALSSLSDPVLAEQRTAERRAGGGDWLFVGRVTPSKAQEDLIKALACYREAFDPRARLHLVGTWMGEDYPRALERYARRLGLADAVRITGSVSEESLATYYATCDIFVCASEHEGFCIPVLEAMGFGLPVVAFDAGAVAETAGTGALVIEDKSPLALATAVDRVLSKEALRTRLIEMGRARSREMSLENGRRRWADAIETAIEMAAGSTTGPTIRAKRWATEGAKEPAKEPAKERGSGASKVVQDVGTRRRRS
jgi:glycosyltransferase involved in cell wall biosynthesis